MVYRDLYCPKCGKTMKDVVFDSINDEPTQLCSDCNTTMKILCNCGSFKLLYDNTKDMCGWSSDNYNSSQYHREK